MPPIITALAENLKKKQIGICFRIESGQKRGYSKVVRFHQGNGKTAGACGNMRIAVRVSMKALTVYFSAEVYHSLDELCGCLGNA